MKWFLPLCILFFSCKTNDNIVGTYTTARLTKFDQVIGYINGYSYSVRNKIILNKDSTFVYETCAMVWRGKWTATPDTLAMHIAEKRFKIEEFNTDTIYSKAL